MHRKRDDDGYVYTMKLDGNNNPLKIPTVCMDGRVWEKSDKKCVHIQNKKKS